MNKRWLAASLALALGCSSSVEVTRVLAPSEAAAPKNAQLSHIAILRGDAEIPVPASAHVEADRVVWPNPGGARVYPLHPGDVILMDERERITAVQSARGVDLVRFVPGTAFSLPSSDEVQGQPEGKETSVPLILGDRIRVRGSFEVDDVVPGGGHVSKSRATGALVAGLVFLSLSYAPAAYVGDTSPRAADRVLGAPVAGPWLDLASRAKCIPAAAGSASATATFVAPCLGDTLTRVALVSAGAVQALAAILVAVGLPSSSQLVYGGDGTAENGHGPRLTILPSIGGTGRPGAGAPGLTAVGTF